MSGIGPGVFGPALASSIVGTTGRGVDADRLKADAADQTTQANQRALTARHLGDVGQSDGTSDRDADGRMPWMLDPLPESHDEAAPKPDPPRSRDALEERGTQLDLEA